MNGFPLIETTPAITQFLANNSPVAIGVSGGKDSTVAAFETLAYLQSVGHDGPVILIHSDLGRVEHKDSLPSCERLASRLRLELVIVRRQAGDLMDRWLMRWQNNVERYSLLQCVKLILPWSTPAMRFCTSELKTAIICRYLVERFPKTTILNVVGIRRQESTNRAQTPIYSAQLKLTHKTFETQGYNWHPILAWSLEDIVAYHHYQSFPLHEAYTTYSMTRVSCAYCILAGLDDLVASATNPDNHDIYREMVGLEIASSFSFQSERWLGDVAPRLLSADMQTGLRDAKRRAELRERTEAKVPKHLLYAKGWPTMMPTHQEAQLLSEVRRSIADIMQISIHYSDSEDILARYAELMAIGMTKRNRMTFPVNVRPIQEGLWNSEHVA